MDIQLQNSHSRLEYIFITDCVSTRVLNFKFKQVVWNAATETNRPVSTRIVIAENFSNEWINLQRAGWIRVG